MQRRSAGGIRAGPSMPTGFGRRTMRITRLVCAATAAAILAGAPNASAQDAPQALQQEIDQLRRDFEALKQQYGDRLTALEAKLAAAQGGQTPAAITQPSPNAPQPPAAVPAETPAQPAQQPTAQVPPGAEGAGGPTGALPVYGAAIAGSKVFNP